MKRTLISLLLFTFLFVFVYFIYAAINLHTEAQTATDTLREEYKEASRGYWGLALLLISAGILIGVVSPHEKNVL